MNKLNNKITYHFCFYVLIFYFTIFLSGLYAEELKEISTFKITAGGQEPLSIATDGSYIYYLWSADSGAHVSRYTMSGQEILTFDIAAGGHGSLSIATDGSYIYYMRVVESGTYVSRCYNSFRASPVKMPFSPNSRTTSITSITTTAPAYQTPLPPAIILRENKQGRQ